MGQGIMGQEIMGQAALAAHAPVLRWKLTKGGAWRDFN